MTRVLMVCLGNICRSPLAQGILEHKLKAKGWDNVYVDSAGTSSFHAGEHPDHRTMENALTHGVDLSHLKSRQFTVEDFDDFDIIYVMDDYNLDDVLKLARNKDDEQKVEMILNMSHPGLDMPVPDPYYSGKNGFENVFQLLDKGCDGIISHLEQDKLRK